PEEYLDAPGEQGNGAGDEQQQQHTAEHREGPPEDTHPGILARQGTKRIVAGPERHSSPRRRPRPKLESSFPRKRESSVFGSNVTGSPLSRGRRTTYSRSDALNFASAAAPGTSSFSLKPLSATSTVLRSPCRSSASGWT